MENTHAEGPNRGHGRLGRDYKADRGTDLEGFLVLELQVEFGILGSYDIVADVRHGGSPLSIGREVDPQGIGLSEFLQDV